MRPIMLMTLFVAYPSFAESKITIATDFPKEWVKGSWLQAVANDYKIETGTTVEIALLSDLVNKAVGAKYIPDMEDYGHNRSVFLGSEYFKKSDHIFDLVTEPESTWGSSIGILSKVEGLDPGLFLKDQTEANQIALKKKYEYLREDKNRHPRVKKFYYDFSQHADLMQLISDDVLKTREPQDYGYLPNAHIGFSTTVFVYNKKIAKKLGLKIPSLGMTLEQLVEYSKKTHAFNSKAKDEDKIVLFRDFEANLIENQIMACYESGRTKNKFTKKNPFDCVFESYDIIAQMIPNDPMLKDRIPKKVLENPWFGIQAATNEFVKGKTLFIILSSSEMLAIKEKNSSLFRRLGFAELPTAEKTPRQSLIAGASDSFQMPANLSEKRQKMALDFLKFVYSESNMRRWSELTNQIPASSKSIKAVNMSRFMKRFALPLQKKYKKTINKDNLWDLSIDYWTCRKKDPKTGEIKNESMMWDYGWRAHSLTWLLTKEITLDELKKKTWNACSGEKKG